MLEKTKLALNIVTDVSLDYAKTVSKEALRLGAESIWIGETNDLPHPFKYLSYISEYVKAPLGTSIISAYLNPVDYVVEFSNEILKRAPKFIIGVGLGDIDHLKRKGIVVKKPLRFMRNYVTSLLRKLHPKASAIIGTAGRRMANLSCQLCGAVMLNLVYPEYVKFIRRNINESCEITVIGPSLIKEERDNSRLIRALRIASAIVLKGMSKKFLEEFELTNIALEVRNYLVQGSYWKLKKHDKLLLEKFSLYGSLDELEEAIKELSKLSVKRVIFGPPLYRKMDLVKKIFSYFLQ